METLDSDGVHFNLEKWRGIDPITGQEIIVVTPKGVIEAGYQVLPLNSSKIDWCFVDIGPHNSDYSLEKTGSETARRLFKGAISKRRMNQALNQIYLGETHGAHIFNPMDYQSKIDDMFDQMISSRTVFYIFRGGTDRNILNDYFVRLLR